MNSDNVIYFIKNLNKVREFSKHAVLIYLYGVTCKRLLPTLLDTDTAISCENENDGIRNIELFGEYTNLSRPPCG